jgi:hypothetical protein
MDAVHRARIHTRAVFGSDTGFCDYVRHEKILLEQALLQTGIDINSIKKSLAGCTCRFSQLGLNKTQFHAV